MSEPTEPDDASLVLAKATIHVTVHERASHFIFAETGTSVLAGREDPDYYGTVGRWLCKNVGAMATADLSGIAGADEEGRRG